MQPSDVSLFHSLQTRELRHSKVKRRPCVEKMTAEGACSGSGVLVVEPNGTSAPPLAISFGKMAENSHLLAVADEDGFVSIFNTRRNLPSAINSQERTGSVRMELWLAHSNAIFDLCWVQDDKCMLTASGDQTVRLWDIEARAGLGVMKGHTGSVKSLCGHPYNPELFASGSRDGCIALWDVRSSSTCSSTNERCFSPVSMIKDAHLLHQTKKLRGSKTVTKSVTAVLYLKDDRVLVTAGAADGALKFWDTRHLKLPVVQSPAQAQVSAEGKETRVHGISGLSQNPSGTYLIASCTDSRVHVYDVYRPEKGPLKSFQGHIMGSFYIKAAFSPDGSHILSGSSDGNVFIWQMDSPEAAPVVLKGHGGEVTAVDWCPTDFCKIATCSDDFTVRVWNNLEPRFGPIRPTPSVFRRRISADPSIGSPLSENSLSGKLEYTCSGSPDYRVTTDASNDDLLEFAPTGDLQGASPESTKKSMSSPGLSPKFKPTVNIFEAADQPVVSYTSPEASSPSSVLYLPSSTKRRKTITDYYSI